MGETKKYSIKIESKLKSIERLEQMFLPGYGHVYNQILAWITMAQLSKIENGVGGGNKTSSVWFLNNGFYIEIRVKKMCQLDIEICSYKQAGIPEYKTLKQLNTNKMSLQNVLKNLEYYMKQVL